MTQKLVLVGVAFITDNFVSCFWRRFKRQIASTSDNTGREMCTAQSDKYLRLCYIFGRLNIEAFSTSNLQKRASAQLKKNKFLPLNVTLILHGQA